MVWVSVPNVGATAVTGQSRGEASFGRRCNGIAHGRAASQSPG